MLSYHSKLFHIVSRTIIAALLTTIVNSAYCQEVSQPSSKDSFLTVARKSLGSLISSTTKSLNAKVASTIGSLSSKLKDSGPQAIIPMLQNALNNLGSKIGTVSACM